MACFQIMREMSKLIDEVRPAEVKDLKAQRKEPVLTNLRWLLLKRSERRREKQFPDCRSAAQARRFLNRWYGYVMRSRLEPDQEGRKGAEE